MKIIKMSEYHNYMGKLIDVEHPLDYKEHPYPGSVNIYYEKLMYQPSKYLNKKNSYYIMCQRGTLSRKTVTYLEYLGYDVTQVLLN
jgi:rhodanese-related sulfurtransferase